MCLFCLLVSVCMLCKVKKLYNEQSQGDSDLSMVLEWNVNEKSIQDWHGMNERSGPL